MALLTCRRFDALCQNAASALAARTHSSDRHSLNINVINRDSPDESQTGINVRAFPALLQDRREVLTTNPHLG